MAKLDPRLAPAYSIAEASRYLRIRAPTVRSWVVGRNYPKRSGHGRFRPVVALPADPNRRLSFRNLIELAALRALRTEHELKLSAVRAALEYARRELHVADLLASRDLYARPGELFLEHYGQLINLNRAGQLGIQAVLQGLLQRIQWDKDRSVEHPSPQLERAVSSRWPISSATHASVCSQKDAYRSCIATAIRCGRGAETLARELKRPEPHSVILRSIASR